MKQKHMPRRPLTSTFKFLLVVAAMELIGCLYFLMHKTDVTLLTLRPSLVPTAQYLAQNPQPTPTDMFITLQYRTYDQYAMYDWGSSLESEVCYIYGEDYESYSSSLSYIVVDGYMSHSRTSPNMPSASLSRPIPHFYCIDRSMLGSGLHLFELHLKRERWDTPYVYQAALLIED